MRLLRVLWNGPLPPPASDATRWPDAPLRDVLVAAAGPPAAAVPAWLRWRTLRDARPDPAWSAAEARLLPLVWWRLRHASRATGIDELQDTYRASWAANNDMLAATARAIKALDEAGVPTMVLKGAGLTLTAYPRTGLRPVGDVDLLVQPNDATRARQLLSGRGLRVHLRTRAFDEYQGTLDDRDLWTRSRHVPVGHTRTRVPSPADHLILICAHGVRWTSTPSVHWLADAAMVLEHERDAIDWAQLLEVTHARRLCLPVRRTLEFLARELGAYVPDQVIASLAAMPVSLRDRLEHEVLMRPPSVPRRLVRQWCEHARLNPGASRRARLANLIRNPTWAGPRGPIPA